MGLCNQHIGMDVSDDKWAVDHTTDGPSRSTKFLVIKREVCAIID